MKVLVTGSSGFVGGALVDHLRTRGFDVRGLSRRPAPGSLTGDLLDRPSLDAALAEFGPAVVVNLAAETDLKGAPKTGYRANTDGVSNLLAAVRTSESVKRVIWASSQLVGRPGVVPASDTAFDPVGGYGASKAEGERRVRDADSAGQAWMIVRSTTIWGPGMSEHYLGLLHLIRRGLYFHVGSEPLRKSYSYIGNLTAQLATLIEAPAAAVHRRVFYLADSEPIELRAWADGFAQAFGRRIPTMPRGAATLLARIGDAMNAMGLRAPLTTPRLRNMLTEYLYDTTPIETLHGRTQIGWAEGIRQTSAWMTGASSTSGGNGPQADGTPT
jgi:nucleoside-diphosphate-sugar epimerase